MIRWFLPFSLDKLGIVTFIASPLSLPLDVFHHEDNDGEGVEGEDEEDVEVGIAVVPSHPSLLVLVQQGQTVSYVPANVEQMRLDRHTDMTW